MVKSTQSPDSSPKREAILDAALELFAELGFHGATVPQIAERARTGAGTIYNYFASKEELVNVLFQKWKSELGRVLMEDFPLDQPMRIKFHEIWKRLAQFAKDHPQALDFLELHHHGQYLDAQSRAVEKELLAPFYLMVEHAQEQKELKRVQPEILGSIVFGSFLGLLTAQRRGLLEMTRKTLDAAEECCWEAVRR
jgi:AcrR family transcriptional regulator